MAGRRPSRRQRGGDGADAAPDAATDPPADTAAEAADAKEGS
jgi:hypothetical protein